MVLLFLVVAAAHAKPNLLVTTDIGGDPDDMQSLRRLLLYSNEFNIVGLIASASGTPGELGQSIVQPQLIHDILADYAAVQPNLSLHAPGFPAAAALANVVHAGNPNRGVLNIGTGNATAGSNHIIAAVDAATAPVHVAIWGGATDLAQALHDVKATRSPAQVNAFVRKLRVHAIADQDTWNGNTYGTGQWIKDNVPGIRYVENGGTDTDRFQAAFRGMYQNVSKGLPNTIPTVSLVENSIKPLNQEAWVNTHIRTDHGPLGANYPIVTQNPTHASDNTSGVKEGDTPSWFFALPIGLSSPEHPEWGGWGGRFEPITGQTGVYADARDDHWNVNADDAVRRKWTIARWRQAYQNDFAARMDWSVKPYAEANHPPVSPLNISTFEVVRQHVHHGDPLTLDGSGWTDPDGDPLVYDWLYYREAGNFDGPITFDGGKTPQLSFTAPEGEATFTLHFVLAVTDVPAAGLFPTTRYQRFVVTVAPEPASALLLGGAGLGLIARRRR